MLYNCTHMATEAVKGLTRYPLIRDDISHLTSIRNGTNEYDMQSMINAVCDYETSRNCPATGDKVMNSIGRKKQIFPIECPKYTVIR